MPQFATQRIVPHSATQMFELVADIQAYPEFLPLCEAMTLRSREVVDGKPVIVADMAAGYKAVSETFTTRVTLDETNCKILVEYLDGPFRYLENVWAFQDAPQKPLTTHLETSSNQHQASGSTVDFYISYEFKSAMLGLLVGGLFDRAFRTFAEAFENRAIKIYGFPSITSDHADHSETVRN